MNHSSNNHPPSQPRNGHQNGRKFSQRGLLSIAMLILSMGALGIAALYRGLGTIATKSSRALAVTQSGFVRWYVMAFAAGAVVFLAIMVFA